MKRLQIMIEQELDEALAAQASTEGVSKAALIRRFVRQHVQPLRALEDDPLSDFAGGAEGAPGDSARIDEVVYGPSRTQ